MRVVRPRLDEQITRGVQHVLDELDNVELERKRERQLLAEEVNLQHARVGVLGGAPLPHHRHVAAQAAAFETAKR